MTEKKKFYNVYIPTQIIQVEAWSEGDAETIASRFMKNVTFKEISEDDADNYYSRSNGLEEPIRHRMVGKSEVKPPEPKRDIVGPDGQPLLKVLPGKEPPGWGCD
jgi:hypothetical protein